MTPKELLHAPVLDIVFENRNKAYGAYVLRRQYNHRLVKALLGMAIIVTAFILYQFIREKYFAKNTAGVFVSRTVELQHVVLPEVKQQPVEKVKQVPVKKQVATIKVTTPKIVPDKQADKLPDLKKMDSALVSNRDKPGEVPDGSIQQPVDKEPGDGGTGEKPLAEVQPEIAILHHAEVMPEYPGGMQKFYDFLQRSLRNPVDMEEGERVNVRVRFVVGADGQVSDLTITENGGAAFDNEVLRVLRKMPGWKPGEQGGRKVAVYFSMPISFVPAG
jgi:periplasmic protein TonB